MLYDSDPLRPHPDDLQRVVGYIVEYASKSTETKKSTRDKMKMLIMQEKENASNTPDVCRVAIKCMNQITKDKLISKQEAMCLTGGLSLFTCSETIETVSLTGYKKLNTDGCIFDNTDIDLYAKIEEIFYHQSFYRWICEKKTRKTQEQKRLFLTL